jgi:hypothetical protein
MSKEIQSWKVEFNKFDCNLNIPVEFNKFDCNLNILDIILGLKNSRFIGMEQKYT